MYGLFIFILFFYQVPFLLSFFTGTFSGSLFFFSWYFFIFILFFLANLFSDLRAGLKASQIIFYREKVLVGIFSGPC